MTNGKTDEPKPSSLPTTLGSPKVNGKPEPKNQNNSGDQHSQFVQNLRELNESVLSWIKQHVEKNPYCILTPIFSDYEKHLKELEKDRDSGESKSGKEKDNGETKTVKESESREIKAGASAEESTEKKTALPVSQTTSNGMFCHF